MTTAALEHLPPHLQCARRPLWSTDRPTSMSSFPSGLEDHVRNTDVRLRQASNSAGRSTAQNSPKSIQPTDKPLNSSKPLQPDSPSKLAAFEASDPAPCQGANTRPHTVAQAVGPASPSRQHAAMPCPVTPPPSPVSTSMIISRASWPRDISPLDLTQTSCSGQKPPRGSPISGRAASGRITDSAMSGPPSGLQRYSIPEALPIQVPHSQSNSALASMLPPILKAYPSQGSLQNMVSSSSGDQTGPLASASLQDGAPRQTMAGQSSESAGLQRGSDGLDTPRAQGILSAPPSPQAASHSPDSPAGNGSLHSHNSRVHGGMPAFAQHIDELAAEDLRERCRALLDLPNGCDPKDAGPANGHANTQPHSLMQLSTDSSRRPASPFMDFSDMSQVLDRETRSRRGTDTQGGTPPHRRNLSWASALDDGSRDNSTRGNSSWHGPASGSSLTTPPTPLTGFTIRGAPSSRPSFPGIEQASSSFSERPLLSHRSSEAGSGSGTHLKQRGSSAALLALQSSSSVSEGSLHLSPSNQQAPCDEARAPMLIQDAEP